MQLKMARKENGKYYKLEEMRIPNLLYLEVEFSLYNLTEEEKNGIYKRQKCYSFSSPSRFLALVVS